MFGIDGRHRLLTELDSGLVDGAIRVPHLGCLAAPEHDIELREAEHESVALVDEGDPHLVGDRLRQPGHELETAESRSENDDVLSHDRSSKAQPLLITA